MRTFLIIILLIGIWIICKKKNKYELIINNVFWIFLSWLFCLALYFFCGIKYNFNLDIYSFGYIITFWVIFLLGQYLSKHIKSRKYYTSKRDDGYRDEKIIDFSKKMNLFPLFIISLISVVIYSLYIVINNNIQIGVTRDINTNAFATVFLLITDASLIIWIYELAYALLNDKRIPAYGFISALIYNLPGVLISGRDALMIFLISTVIVTLYCGNYAKKTLKIKGKMYKRIKKYSICAAILMLAYLILLSNNRYGVEEDSAINMFVWSTNCEFPSYLEYIYYKWR